MKPIKVEFQAFGPYRGYEVVDFSLLSSKGLFLICGGTGTGKTTVLDAMTFALYGKSSGGLRDSFEQMRCKNADDKTDTFVKIEFENNGQFYIFERRLQKKRVNLHKSFDGRWKDPDGNWQVFFENTKESDLNKKAVEIIGLDYSQFVQVIILPQGKFEKLLVSSTDDKEKILSNIFGEDMWQKIAEKIYSDATEKKEALKAVKEKVRISLMEENCESLEGLRQIIEGKKQEEESLSKEFKDSDYDGVIKRNSELLELAARFEKLDEFADKKALLGSRKDEIEGLKNTLKEAKRAAKIKPSIESVAACKKDYDDRIRGLEQLEENVKSASEKKAEASILLEEQLLKESDIEKLKAQKVQYEGKIDAYKEVGTAKEELFKAEKSEVDARQEEDKAKEHVSRLDGTIVNLQNEYKELDEEHRHILAVYIDGITGELASQLKDGDECPVCGSTTHPHKAKLLPITASKDEVELKKSELDAKYDELQKAIANKDNAEKELKRLHDSTEGLHNIAIQCKAKYDSVITSLIEGIDSYEILINEIKKIDAEVEAFAKKKSQYEEEVKKYSEEYTAKNSMKDAALSEVKLSEERLKDSEEELKSMLAEYNIESEDEAKKLIRSDEEIEDITKTCADYDSEVKYCNEELCKLNEELNGKERPDAILLKKQVDEAHASKESFAKKFAVIEKEIADLSEKEKRLAKELEGLDEKINDADTDWAMAKKLRGDTGVGLQRYVLGIMFSQVVAEANKMLELFNGGRYRLFRSDDKFGGSNKSGLELKVIDKYSDDKEGRFVHTLSGGEKFLTSLALSIGMSSVAKRGGIRIDAMFIDEGFGTLDVNCVNDAMNILTSIQEANGIVGIISHMPLLKERIATKLIAVDDGNGSHLVQTVG
ncbi:MAG: SMC family ATPase [Lachnospiraceae bacterium]|nr:SMC family ATPase [Lachnospiraceae bacterium]